MARTETFEAKVYLNQKEAQNAMAELEAQIVDTAAALKKFNEEKNSKKSIEAEQHLKRLRKQYEEAKHGVENYRKALDNLNGQSLNELIRMQKAMKRELDRTKPDTEEWKRMAKEYQQVTERIDSLKKAQKGIVTEGQKSTNAFKTLFGKVNEFYGGLLVYAKAAKAAFQAIIGVTKQVVNASQTMGDKWNNGMAAMKTSTEAFFMALSTGDWSAFNDGILAALKNARDLAETMDLLGSFQIAGGYMQAKYRTDYTSQMTEATNTENDAATRLAALDAAKADIDAQREFTEREAKATFEALESMFKSWKGIVFGSQEEFDSFFDRLFRYTTTGADKAVEEIVGLKSEVDKYVAMVNNAARSGFVPEKLLNNLEAAQAAYNEAISSATKETLDLVAAADLNDEKHKELIQTYAQWRGNLQRIDQDEKTYNRTRDRVIKQIGEQKGSIVAVIASIDEWVENERQAALERFEANKASFDSIADAYREYQDELADIEAEGEAKREAARQKFVEQQRKELESERQKRQAAADKAYQNAQNKVAKAEAAQINTLKGLYAAGIMDKATYEAQKAVVEEDYLKQRMATAEQYGKDTDQFMSQLLDRQIARMEKAKAMLKEEIDEMARYQAGLDEADASRFGSSTGDKGIADQEAYDSFQEKIWQKAADIRAAITEDSARTQYETEMKWIEKLHKDGLLSDEDFEKAKLDQRLKFAAKIAQEVNRYAEMASNFANALKESETAKMEAEYQAQLTAAGDNAEERERIEAEYEQKKLDMQKKYADVDMVINIAKAIASGALAAVEAFAAAGGNPVLGGIFAAIIAATTAVEIATIVAQRNAIKNASVGGGGSSSVPKTGERKMTGYAEGGYTEDHTTLTTVGEKGREWVGPAWMVRKNPVMFANLERYRKAGSHGRSGSMSCGFADGGFTPGKGGGPSAAMPEQIDIEAAVEAAIRRVMADGAIRAYVVRKDIEELDAQTLKFKKLGSR